QANLADFGAAIGSDENLREVFRSEITESVGTLRAAFDAGVPLLTGSESGFSLTPYGDWHYRELQVFVEDLGMTPLQAINSATQQGARALKLEGQLGCIKPDYLADILVFEGEPETTVTQLGDQSRYRHIIKNGQEVDTKTPLARDWQLPGWRVSEYSERILTRELVESMGLSTR
ncbi:amidohydrolase family protein, partial [Luminiphilus sp.]|nr:amidohydrolase family protein [Luminiphilus sp.]